MSAVLTSPQAHRLRAVRRLGKRAFRAADRRFLAEGPQSVTEAVAAAETGDSGALLDLVATVEGSRGHPDLLARAAALGVPATLVSGEVMGALASTVHPQGLLGISAFRDVSMDQLATSATLLVAVLVDVRDPGNAGTVLRTADAVGADGVVFAGTTVDPYNAKCVRASAGSVYHLPFAVGAAPADAMSALRAAGLTILAAAADAPVDLESKAGDGGLAGPTAWVFGNEAWGLAPEVRANCDAAVRVPIYGRAESLNLATAGAVCLYASARAQRAPGGVRRPGGAVE